MLIINSLPFDSFNPFDLAWHIVLYVPIDLLSQNAIITSELFTINLFRIGPALLPNFFHSG